jgi:hypothetical protein
MSTILRSAIVQSHTGHLTSFATFNQRASVRLNVDVAPVCDHRIAHRTLDVVCDVRSMRLSVEVPAAGAHRMQDVVRNAQRSRTCARPNGPVCDFEFGHRSGLCLPCLKFILSVSMSTFLRSATLPSHTGHLTSFATFDQRVSFQLTQPLFPVTPNQMAKTTLHLEAHARQMNPQPSQGQVLEQTTTI